MTSNGPEITDSFGERCRGFLLGTAIGDAMGVPFEGLPPIEDVEPADFWKGFATPPYDPNATPGRTSDDTQFTVLAMLSLSARRGSDPTDLAGLLAREMRQHRTPGWGVSITGAVGRMVYEGAAWNEAGSEEGNAGNGAAMRAGPYGLFPWNIEHDMAEAVVEASRITHRDSDACAGAVAIASAHRILAAGGTFSATEFRDAVAASVRPFSGTLADLIDETVGADDSGSVIERLSLLGRDGHPQASQHGIGGYVLPSVAAALHLFAAHPRDPAQALGRTMLAGGDTDTVGSLVGGLVGTLNGEGVWPEHLSSNVQDVERLIGVADSFADVCLDLIGERECAAGGM